MGTLVESVAQIADTFDRLVTLLEDLADALEIPHYQRKAAEAEAEETL